MRRCSVCRVSRSVKTLTPPSPDGRERFWQRLVEQHPFSRREKDRMRVLKQLETYPA
jgi:hypothetical protein